MAAAPVVSHLQSVGPSGASGRPCCSTAFNLSVRRAPSSWTLTFSQRLPSKTFLPFHQLTMCRGPVSPTDLFCPPVCLQILVLSHYSSFCSGTSIIQLLDVGFPPPTPRVLPLLHFKSLLHVASSGSGGLGGVSLTSRSEHPEGLRVTSFTPSPDTLPCHTELPPHLRLPLSSSLHLCFPVASSISSFK